MNVQAVWDTNQSAQYRLTVRRRTELAEQQPRHDEGQYRDECPWNNPCPSWRSTRRSLRGNDGCIPDASLRGHGAGKVLAGRRALESAEFLRNLSNRLITLGRFLRQAFQHNRI